MAVEGKVYHFTICHFQQESVESLDPQIICFPAFFKNIQDIFSKYWVLKHPRLTPPVKWQRAIFIFFSPRPLQVVLVRLKLLPTCSPY